MKTYERPQVFCQEDLCEGCPADNGSFCTLTKGGLSTLFQTNFFRLFFRYCTGV